MRPIRRPTGLPDGAVPLTSGRLGVLCAVAVQRHPDLGSVAAYADVPKATVYSVLKLFRDLGLVTWSPGLTHTLRPTFELCPVVPHSRHGDL